MKNPGKPSPPSGPPRRRVRAMEFDLSRPDDEGRLVEREAAPGEDADYAPVEIRPDDDAAPGTGDSGRIAAAGRRAGAIAPEAIEEESEESEEDYEDYGGVLDEEEEEGADVEGGEGAVEGEDAGPDADVEDEADDEDEEDEDEADDEDEEESEEAASVAPTESDAAAETDGGRIDGRNFDRSRSRLERLPTIAIVGRPNTGKSTLFNCLANRRIALVHDRPGMTRDRRMRRIEWGRRGYLLVDTGGFDPRLDDPLLADVAEQARIAIQEADAIVWLVAVGEQNHPAELEMERILRRTDKPVFVAVNKCDNDRLEHQANDWYSLGIGEIFPMSAMHARGISPLMEAIGDRLDELGVQGREFVSGGIRVAIVGRQNVGKSTLVNKMIGEERVIAADLPGTTRDAIDTTFRTPEGDVFTIIDTAGIRRRGKVERGVEKISVLSSMLAIRRADVAILVVDGPQGLAAQDAHIAGYCLEAGCACIVAVNKWDVVEKDHRTADAFTKSLQREWPFLAYAPIVYVSARSGQRVAKLPELVKRVFQNAARRIPTPKLNEMVRGWTAHRPPPIARNVRPKIKYAAQTGVHPPRFKFFVNVPEAFHFSYRRYLTNCLREAADFEGTPVLTHFVAKSDRAKGKAGEEA